MQTILNSKSSFAFPFTVNTGYNSTSTVIGFNGLFSTASSTFSNNLYLSNLSQGFNYLGSNGLVQTISTSTLSGQVFPFTSNSGYNSTSTVIGFNGLFSTASSTFSNNLYLSNLSQGFNYLGSNGLVQTIATSSLNLPNSALANSTISGVSLGGSLYSLSHDTSLTGTSYNGSASVSDLGLALNHTNTWTVLQNFNYSSSTVYSSFLTASTTNLILNGQSFNNLLGAGLTNSSGALSVSTSQNISTLSNLTSNGLIYTAGGTGALNIIATTSVSCSGTVSCAGFNILGSSPITITGSGGGSGN